MQRRCRRERDLRFNNCTHTRRAISPRVFGVRGSDTLVHFPDLPEQPLSCNLANIRVRLQGPLLWRASREPTTRNPQNPCLPMPAIPQVQLAPEQLFLRYEDTVWERVGAGISCVGVKSGEHK